MDNADALTEASPLSADKQPRPRPSSQFAMPPRALRSHIIAFLKSNLLTIFTVIGVFSGVAFGVILRHSRSEKWTPREIMYVSFVGDIFLQMLKSLILPLIMSSIITAIGTLDLSLSGKIGARAIAYYFTTTVSAVILGMILSSAIHPGRGDTSEIARSGSSRNVTTVDTLMDLIRNMFPPNLVQAAIAQTQTALIPPTEEELAIAASSGRNLTLYDWKITKKSEEQPNLMGLVVFSVVMGITLSRMGDSGKPLLDFFCSLGAAMMIITNWVIWISPIGVFFLIAGKLLEMESFEVIVGQLGMYFMTVMLGLFIHGFIILPIYYTIATRKLPFRFIANLSQALFTAFGTASSNATLPVSMRLLETKNDVDTRVSRFVMPIGATINMDGTALYEAVAAIFISQVRNVGLSLGQLIAVSITATAASIGAAGIPQAGLVTMVMVLDTVGLPPEDVTLIIAVDWLLDRFRTTINVLGDSLGAGIVNHLSKRELEKMAMPAILDADKLDSQNGKISPEEVEWHTTAM
ncbi:excitatory amino acid transporter 1 isoform X1 [Schistocerca cancellata]|uniref:excitatory amino acid transporter 1 isoform X1 n=1 Tax=Schistocerca cancellata TaxID=274614 RepID=UPI002117724C|nr:excitatory amino acid transporter 1 isoform X1 [Schistocerca cancellata]